MTIIVILGVAVAICATATLTIAFLTSNNHDDEFIALKKYTEDSVKTSNINFSSIATRFEKEGEQIEDIIKRLEAITADIHRLDEEVTKVKKDEREIRSYYVNFRTPSAYSAGVPWAEDFKCVDDIAEDQKIGILNSEADAYRQQLSHNGMSREDRYITLKAYANCLKELKQLKEKANE